MRPGDLLHVGGAIWLLAGEQQGRFPRSHSVLVRDRETALIDTGCGLAVLRDLDRRLSIARVLNTHSHPDHSAGNFLFAGRPTFVPRQAAASAGSLERLSRRFFDDEALAATWRRFVSESMGFEDTAPTGWLDPGQEIRVGATRLVVVHTPGHTIDHCCFYEPQQGILVAADLDLTAFGPWYGHAESSLDDLRRSIAAVRALEPRTVVSAHRLPVDHDVDRALAAFLSVIDVRTARLLDLLRRGERTWDEIVDAALVYGRFPYAPELMREWEALMIGKHLEELVGREEVRRTERGYVASGC